MSGYTLAEILSQPDAWTDALAVLRTQADTLQAFSEGFDSILYTGCGSTYYLSLAAAALTQQLTGVPSRALPASEVWLNPAAVPQGKTLLVAVSRSGETTETLRAVEVFMARGTGQVIVLTCYGDSALALMGDLTVVLPSGQEQSVAQTRAFSVLYLAATVLAALWGGRTQVFNDLAPLSGAGRDLLRRAQPLAQTLGRQERFEHFYFLGSGERYGLACELSLKMKEMSLSHSEPFHVLEFRHGPQSMVNERTLIVALLSDGARSHEAAVLDEMRARGAQVVRLGISDADMIFGAPVDEALSGVLYLPFGQLLAYERAVTHGLDPDRPHNLSAVVRLSDS